MLPLDDDTSLDAALRRAARVHDALVNRVAQMALAPPERQRALVVWAAVTVAFVMCAAGLSTWWPPKPPVQRCTIETTSQTITVRAADGTTFIASWQPGDDLPPGTAIVVGGGGTR